MRDQDVGTPERKDGDPHAAMTMVAALTGALVVLVIVLALQALYLSSENAERKVKNDVPSDELTGLRAGQLERLNTYRWLDPAHRMATVPIDRAMELVVRDQGRNPAPVAAAPAPAPAPAPAAGSATP